MNEFISNGVGQVIYNIVSSVMYEVLVVSGTFLAVGIVITILATIFSKNEEK